jgi:hypothetical protein
VSRGRPCSASGLEGKSVTVSSPPATSSEFRCARCGYGIIVSGALPTCPMCRTTSWKPARYQGERSAEMTGRLDMRWPTRTG